MSLRRAGLGIAIAAASVVALLVGVAGAAPLTGFDVAPDPATAGDPVTFTANDPCAEPVTCVWDFGDGSGGATGRQRQPRVRLGRCRDRVADHRRPERCGTPGDRVEAPGDRLLPSSTGRRRGERLRRAHPCAHQRGRAVRLVGLVGSGR